jgi:hypothetical protein
MKRCLLFMALVCAPALLFARDGEGNASQRDGVSFWEAWSIGVPIRGNGNPMTAEISVSAFESIQINYASVFFHVGPEYRAVVTVDSNLYEQIRIYNQNDVLRIGTRRGRHFFFTQYRVDLYAPSLSGVTIAGAGRFEGRDTIKSSVFRSNISGSGKITGSFECDDFSAGISGSGEINAHVTCKSLSSRISGSGDLKLTGSTDDLDINISGSGDVLGREFQTKDADVRISGSGNMHIWVLENLRASISGSGRVRYRGNPKIDFRGSGSGRIQSE